MENFPKTFKLDGLIGEFRCAETSTDKIVRLEIKRIWGWESYPVYGTPADIRSKMEK